MIYIHFSNHHTEKKCRHRKRKSPNTDSWGTLHILAVDLQFYRPKLKTGP